MSIVYITEGPDILKNDQYNSYRNIALALLPLRRAVQRLYVRFSFKRIYLAYLSTSCKDSNSICQKNKYSTSKMPKCSKCVTKFRRCWKLVTFFSQNLIFQISKRVKDHPAGEVGMIAIYVWTLFFSDLKKICKRSYIYNRKSTACVLTSIRSSSHFTLMKMPVPI